MFSTQFGVNIAATTIYKKLASSITGLHFPRKLLRPVEALTPAVTGCHQFNWSLLVTICKTSGLPTPVRQKIMSDFPKIM